MSNERRIQVRWPIAIAVRISLHGAWYDTNLLNVNLGGCFLEGSFGAQVGDVLLLQSAYNPELDNLRGQIVWVVEEPNLRGIGVQFEPIEESRQFSLIRWFNQMAPLPH